MSKFLKKKGVIPILAIIPVVLLLIALAAFSVMPKSSLINIEGDVEITTVPYFSFVTGSVEEMFFEMGEIVPKGAIIATIDKKEALNQIQQLKESLTMKEARLSELAKGTNNKGIDAAREVAKSNITIFEEKVNVANKALENARKDLELKKALYDSEAISLVELEAMQRKVSDQESMVEIAKSELNSARNTLDTITYPESNDGEIKVAQADARLVRLQINQLQDSMEDYNIVAMEEGILIEKLVQVGSFITKGGKIAELSKENEKHFVFYLPEEYIDLINYGDTIKVVPLSTKRKKEEYEATVKYIDYKAIYTPKEAEGASNKNKRSMKIKAILSEESSFRAGERAIIQLDTKSSN